MLFLKIIRNFFIKSAKKGGAIMKKLKNSKLHVIRRHTNLKATMNNDNA